MAKYEEERKHNPSYPFRPTMKFCAEHSPDSDIVDVDQCSDCKKPGKVDLSPKAKAVFRSEEDVVATLNKAAEETPTPGAEQEEDEWDPFVALRHILSE